MPLLGPVHTSFLILFIKKCTAYCVCTCTGSEASSNFFVGWNQFHHIIKVPCSSNQHMSSFFFFGDVCGGVGGWGGFASFCHSAMTKVCFCMHARQQMQLWISSKSWPSQVWYQWFLMCRPICNSVFIASRTFPFSLPSPNLLSLPWRVLDLFCNSSTEGKITILWSFSVCCWGQWAFSHQAYDYSQWQLSHIVINNPLKYWPKSWSHWLIIPALPPSFDTGARFAGVVCVYVDLLLGLEQCQWVSHLCHVVVFCIDL